MPGQLALLGWWRGRGAGLEQPAERTERWKAARACCAPSAHHRPPALLHPPAHPSSRPLMVLCRHVGALHPRQRPLPALGPVPPLAGACAQRCARLPAACRARCRRRRPPRSGPRLEVWRTLSAGPASPASVASCPHHRPADRCPQVRDYSRWFYRQLASYLARGGCQYHVSHVFIWNLPCWDVQARCRGVEGTQGSTAPPPTPA